MYILECADGTYYVGHTSNLNERVKVHNEGKGALWTASRRPVKLVYHEPHASKDCAVQRELQLKRWTHDKKRALVKRDSAKLKLLAKRRIR